MGLEERWPKILTGAGDLYRGDRRIDGDVTAIVFELGPLGMRAVPSPDPRSVSLGGAELRRLLRCIPPVRSAGLLTVAVPPEVTDSLLGRPLVYVDRTGLIFHAWCTARLMCGRRGSTSLHFVGGAAMAGDFAALTPLRVLEVS